jgi:SAM-dependent methyltransferase
VTAYDEVPYTGRPYPDTHPERLATMALLHGVEAAPVDRCRVLEVACGDGANLLPMAAALPRSEFMGFDLASKPVEAGRALAARAGLANVRLEQRDLADFPADAGSFDYIVAHGLYSWIPADARDKLLALVGRHLAPRGVAFVSYNVYPGCYIRRMVWEMLRFHTDPLDEPGQKITEAKALARLLAEGRTRDDAYAFLLRGELERFASRDAGALYHDDLSPVNEPCWFHEFVGHAGRHGLQFLCEAEQVATSYFGLGDAARRVLEDLEPLVRQQYLDFAKCRRFRQTLLCRENVDVDHASGVERVESFGFSARAPGLVGEPEGAHSTPPEEGVARRIVEALKSAAPNALGLDAIAARVPGVERGRLRELCFAAATAGVAQLHSQLPEISRTLRDRPLATALARCQAEAGAQVSTLRHAPVNLDDDLARRMLALMDGSRDAASIAHALGEDHAAVEGRLEHLSRLGLVA